jgi:hypothetical protein
VKKGCRIALKQGDVVIMWGRQAFDCKSSC